MKKKILNNQGFTAIELLVVILLIGVLASTSVLFLGNSRAKARDAKRMVDVRRIQTALEFYNLENDSYPVVNQAIALGTAQYAKLCDSDSGGFVPLQTECKTVYMSPVPGDPNGDGYAYIGSQAGYSIRFSTEKKSTLGNSADYFAHSQSLDKSAQIK